MTHRESKETRNRRIEPVGSGSTSSWHHLGFDCIIDKSTCHCDQMKSEPASTYRKNTKDDNIILPFLWRNRSGRRSTPQKRFFLKVTKASFAHKSFWKTDRNSPMLLLLFFFKSPTLVGKREKERGGRRKERGTGEEGGDEWEWWVYWVLSGWVDGGWTSSRAGWK